VVKEVYDLKVGFIGTGSMGTTLIEALVQSKALEATKIIANNRTVNKVQQLANRYPGLQIAHHNTEVIQQSDIVFLCIKPLDFKTVLTEIKPAVKPNLIIISITSSVLIHHLEQQLCCKIAKIIPSITNYVCGGASLCMYGGRIMAEDKLLLEQLMMSISRPIHLPEQFTRITSDLSSCGPAFIAFIIEQWIHAAVELTGIEQNSAEQVASEMLLGTGKLLTEGGFTLQQLRQRVTVPGGITAEALKLLATELDDVFHQLIHVTHAKYEADLHKIETQLLSSQQLSNDDIN